MKKVFKLGYIHCAGCSVALQDKISKVENVKSAQINFVTRLVTVEIENKNHKETMQNIEDAIHEFDKTIEILPADAEEKESKNQKISKYLLVLSMALWVIGIVLQYTTGHFVAFFSVYLISYMLVAYKTLWNSLKSVVKGKILDETFLMSIASIGAFVIGEYLEGCAVMIFYSIGEIFQKRATEKSERRIKGLADLKSTTANLVNEYGEIKTVDLNLIKIGDKICVNAGEKVPLDGKIISGSANFNTAAITGDSACVYLSVGSDIISGYIAEDGSVIVEIATTAQNSTISKIVQMVEDASASKAHSEKFIAKFAKVYTPIVVGLALIICFVMPIFGGYSLDVFKLWAYRGLSFLVVSCPCALVLSVPLSYFIGVGSAAKSGILVKGSNYLEILAKTKNVFFDKTGTLTTGEFSVINVVSVGEKDTNDILELIAYAESFSNHRIAKSIVHYYQNETSKTINTAWVNGYKEIAGGGVIANIFMEDCIVGNAHFMKDNGIDIENIDTHDTVVYLAINGNLIGYVCVADTIKPDGKETITELNKMGIVSGMFTGDKTDVAKNVAASLGLQKFYAELMPEDKTNKISEIATNGNIAFVGDGINDAPAIASADVGIAMGAAGSDIAIESSDVVVLTDEPYKVVEAIKIAKHTQSIVVQNIVFTILFKVATLVLVSFGIAGMWLAVLADVGVNILAILNSLRAMKRFNKKHDKKI